MIYIQKNEEPDEIVRWKRKFKNVHGRVPQYDDIRQAQEKKILKEALMSEQKKVCCYCCTRLRIEQMHIEHFRPQSTYPDLSLEYDNLLASCQGEKQLGKNCGHAKKNQFDETLMISPLEEGCEQHFVYQWDGTVESASMEDKVAKYTIDVLALNERRLCKARETAIWESGVFTNSWEENHQMLLKYDDSDIEELPPYWDAIRYFLLEEENKGEV